MTTSKRPRRYTAIQMAGNMPPYAFNPFPITPNPP